MVDLEKIKRDVSDVCQTLDNAFIALCDRGKEYEEVERQIAARKAELLLLDERKMSVIQSVRDEQAAAIEEKKQYTTEKKKYQKLRDEEALTREQAIAETQSELDSLRMSELSLLKSDKDKITSEIATFTQERDSIRGEYLKIKGSLNKLKERISI